MSDLAKLPYAEWLEQALRNIIGTPVESIAIITQYKGGDICTGYYECSVSDKILFAGYLQQDATLDALRANGLVPDEDDEEDTDE